MRYSDDSGGEYERDTSAQRSGLECARAVFMSRDNATGALRSRPYFCKSWACERCARYRVEAAMRHAQHCLHGRERVWCAVVHGDVRKVRENMKNRRRKMARRLGETVEYLAAVHEIDAVVFLTYRLGGTGPPEHFMYLKVERALAILRGVALRVPGATRVPSTSAGWNRTGCAMCKSNWLPAETRLRAFGSRARLATAFDAFGGEVYELTGVLPELDQDPPPAIPLAVWVRLTEKYFDTDET
jgi:hypothetical protein